MRIFRSGNASSQKPSPAESSNVVGVGVPIPKSPHRIHKFFSFGRPPKHKTRQADSNNAIVIPSSSHASFELGISRQGMVQGDLVTPTSPFSHSQFITPSTALDAAQTLGAPSPFTPLSIHHASPSPTAGSGPGQGQDLLVMPQPSSATASQLSLHSKARTIPAHHNSPQPWDGNSYHLQAGQDIRMIQESKNVYVDGDHSHVNYTNTFVNSSTKFMAELLQATIQGAAFDSSDRDPPPRCHPGTRLTILNTCLKFIANRVGEKNMLWVVGQAGVGKSAIMQNIAESPLPSVSERASIFLSINGRNDGSKIVMTLAYQLAAQCEPYHQFIEREITRHPALLRSSMSVQFKKFLIEPFIDTRLSNSMGHILILVDGLDECDKPETQCELLRLITDMCSAHPSSPIVWIIASRPEHHITSFFAQDNVQAVYAKEEIQVDSDEARRDVEQFLRAELTRIQKQFSISPGSQWPPEQEFWKLASAAGGLFVYAQTVTKYIGSLAIGDPISQLDDVLKVIDALPLSDVPREQHPLILLDALYARILSKVPKRNMVNARRILLALVLELGSHPKYRKGGFLVLCNWLGMTCDEAYAAIRHLGSVLDVPIRDKALEQKLRPFHKSFIDYISDFSRSGFSSDIEHEARQLDNQYTVRILEQAPGGIDCVGNRGRLRDFSGMIIGRLATVPDAGSDIILTWSVDEDSIWGDNKTRLEVYKWACSNVVEGIRTGQPLFCTESYIRLVTTQFGLYLWGYFPFREFIDIVFEESRRHELLKSGLLKKVSIEEIDLTTMIWETKLRFRRPSGTKTNVSDSWNASCEHRRTGIWSEGEGEDWTTEFSVSDRSNYRCDFCCQRLEQQLEEWKIRSPDQGVPLLLTSAGESFVEFHFVDPDDGHSEWTYWIMLEIAEEKRRTPGSAM